MSLSPADIGSFSHSTLLAIALTEQKKAQKKSDEIDKTYIMPPLLIAVDNHIYLIESLQRLAEGDLHTFLAQYDRK